MNEQQISSIDWGNTPTQTAQYKIYEPPEYHCPIHGNIGGATISSTLPNLEMDLCLYCYMEKMAELGVTKVTRIK